MRRLKLRLPPQNKVMYLSNGFKPLRRLAGIAFVLGTLTLPGCADKEIPTAPQAPASYPAPMSISQSPSPVYVEREPYAPPDESRGAQLFRKCAPCHTITNDGYNGIGPNLFGVAGRAVAGAPGYKFSDAMKAKGRVWDNASLDAFLTSPKDWILGNKMTFRGIDSAEDRLAIIEFLNRQK